MTIIQAISTTDEMKPNAMSATLKYKYLTEIEQLVHHVHHPEQETKPVYTEDTDDDTELLVPDPYSMLYVYWLMSKIDIQTQEDGRYNIDRAHFENAWETMSDWWTRNHRPIQKVREFSI